MRLFADKQRNDSYVYLIKWIVLALIGGAVGACAVQSFRFLLATIGPSLR